MGESGGGDPLGCVAGNEGCCGLWVLGALVATVLAVATGVALGVGCVLTVNRLLDLVKS